MIRTIIFLSSNERESEKCDPWTVAKVKNTNEHWLKLKKYVGPKLRGVHWTTVDEANTKGTIWEGRKRTFSTVSHIFQDVEDVFAPGTMARTDIPTQRITMWRRRPTCPENARRRRPSEAAKSDTEARKPRLIREDHST